MRIGPTSSICHLRCLCNAATTPNSLTEQIFLLSKKRPFLQSSFSKADSITRSEFQSERDLDLSLVLITGYTETGLDERNLK